jgi:hypothetical protein
MAYTHTFELLVTGMERMEGELDFSNPNNGIKLESVVDMEISSNEIIKLINLIKSIFGVCHKCGEINKLEILKK